MGTTFFIVRTSGDYGPKITLEKLKDFHWGRIIVLANTGPDILALETIPLKLEAQILEEEDIKLPAYLSFTSKNGTAVVRGDPLAECVEMADRSEKVIAVGTNRTPPRLMAGLIHIARQVTSKPILVYWNRGEDWDANEKEWIPSTGSTDDDFVRYIIEWKQAGANLIGGCCQMTPATVRAIPEALFHVVP